MCIFYIKSFYCGCKIIAAQFSEDKNCIFLVGHSYKWICNECINLSDEILDTRLQNIKQNDNKIYISFINGWYRSPSSPIEYTIPNKHLVFGIDYY